MHRRDPEEVRLLYERMDKAKQDLPLAFGWLQQIVGEVAASSWAPYSGSAAHWIREATKLGLTNDMMLYVQHIWSQTRHVPDKAAVWVLLKQLKAFRSQRYWEQHDGDANWIACPSLTEELCLQFQQSITLAGRAVQPASLQALAKGHSK